MNKLIVKNFGPLKDVEIELNKINLFIGENGSGKSVLAKLITIISDMGDIYRGLYDGVMDISQFKNDLDTYNISYLTNNSFIHYYNEDETFSFYLNNNVLISNNDIVNYLLDEKEEKVKNIFSTSNEDSIEIIEKLGLNNDMTSMLNKFSLLSSRYIPAERNFISLFNKSLSTLLVADVPLPKFLLQFSSEFEKAGNTVKELNVLNVKYVNTDSQNRHKIYYDENQSLDLSESSSGIQSAIPLYLTVKYLAKKHKSIIIEEPEQNLFPKAQKETVEFIVENMNDDNALFMMTHSPYILTSLNNLILANDVKEQKGLDAINGIVDEKHCVAFEDVSAYSIVDGKAIDIMDKEDRLIGVNVIDSISDEVSHIFDTLLSKLD